MKKNIALMLAGSATTLLTCGVICAIWARIAPESFDGALDIYKP